MRAGDTQKPCSTSKKIANTLMATALALTCVPFSLLSAAKAADAASTLPTKIVNGDFSYTGLTEAMWTKFGNEWNGSVETSTVGYPVQWTHIHTSTKQYGAFGSAENKWLADITGFDQSKFGWKSNEIYGRVEIRTNPNNRAQSWSELVCHEVGTYIYQDIATTPGAVYKWKLDHAPSVFNIIWGEAS